MPNYCYNQLTVEGNINEIKPSLINDEGNFSFQCLLPLPEELSNTTSPTTRVPNGTDKIEYVRETYSYLNTEEEIIAKSKQILTDFESGKLQKLYGFDNRYDWQCTNRGTKRDACEPNIGSDASDNYLYICFDTAWSPPEAWFATLCKAFPTHIFTLEFEEEGMEFEGTMHSNDDGTYRVDWREFVRTCEYYGEKIEGTRYIESLGGDYSEEALEKHFICLDEDNDEYVEPTLERTANMTGKVKPHRFYDMIFVAQKSFGAVQKGDYLRMDGSQNALRGCTQTGVIHYDRLLNPIIPMYGLSDFGAKPIETYIKNNVFTFFAFAND